MREIVHLQAGQCGNQIGAKVRFTGSNFAVKITGPKRSWRCQMLWSQLCRINSSLNFRFFLSFGKLFQTNMELTQLVHITVILTSS